MTRTVVREWRGKRYLRAAVSTAHPQFGPMFRGTITAVPSDSVSMAWTVKTMDYEVLTEDGPFLGDYLDAEALLLDATAALDEEVPADGH